VNAADWENYQQCPECFTKLGKPCLELSGFVAGPQGGVVEVLAAEPHSTRKLRAEAARTGGDRA
jgi:hypothetical protein